MALFKNLYLDLGFLNPFKKKQYDNKPAYTSINQISPGYSPSINPGVGPPNKIRDLPNVSKRLLDDHPQAETVASSVRKELPALRPAAPPTISQKPIEKPAEEVQHELREEIPVASGENTFFSHLHKKLSSGDHKPGMISAHVLNKNLFDEMHGFWQNKKSDLDNNEYNVALKEDLMKKMEELQQLEVEWQKLQFQHETLKDQVSSKEILIETNIKNLKNSFKKLHLNSDVKEEHQFILQNGSKLKNLRELKDQLPGMDMKVFYSHVTPNKNDFANWVNDVMGLTDLAHDIKQTQTKKSMHDVIDSWIEQR